ncbi:UNVERIFIED_CONTAM: hypothetical protein FKN15_029487 [Acipenser sinensis]
MAAAEERKEVQRDFGVFYDDDYNYLQHLKEPSCPAELVSSTVPQKESRIVITQYGEVEEESETISAPSINLPSSVFASEFEEEVGLLNKAAPRSGPRLDMDPDIVAALDEDFNFDDPDNILEDDFIMKANEAAGKEGNNDFVDSDEDEWKDTDEDQSDDEGENANSDGLLSDEGGSQFESRVGKMKEFMFMNEETKSRFTEYSITSSVIRRNEQLTLLDDRFDKFYEQFDEDEIGALDNAELEGFIDAGSSRLHQVIDDYFKQKAKEYQKPDDLGPKELPVLNEEDEEDEKEEMETLVIEESKEKWDCDSILSTYSNLYNHPKIIKDPPKLKPIKVSRKTGIPLNVLPEKGLTAKQVERMQMINDSDLPRVSTQQRAKDETKEERKTRKQAIKEERKGLTLDRKGEIAMSDLVRQRTAKG